MCGSNVTCDADKISFVRSQLVPKSLAFTLMTASGFDPKHLKYNYAQFRTNFLQIFGVPVSPDSLQFAHHFAESLTSNLSNLGHLRAQAVTAQIANEALESLKAAQWIVNDQISVDRLKVILEYLMYVPLLTPQERRAASSLEFKLDETIINFAVKISKKLKEKETPSFKVAPVVSPVSSHSSPQAAVSLPQAKDPHSTSVPNRSSFQCSYCGKDGHTSARCFKRKRDVKKPPCASPLPKAHSNVDNRPSQTHVSASSSRYSQSLPKSNRNARPLTQRPSKYCAIHDIGSHSTEECNLILNMKHDLYVTPQQSNFHQRQQNKNTG